MATRNISLTDELDRFIEDQVQSGLYQNASEVVRDALRVLAAQRAEQAARLARLRAGEE
ncbi:MAG: type II toxin-antitoxin system ParD family antitoxin [Hydrogenophilaceae bacterium]|jgi:antitoxin ParD1/3/4|nr:type II toxin-antitoxin system ParD family antitoxin [Hydrogenophilaceae bacterium]